MNSISKSTLRNDHHRISPTARMMAYLRSFCDIPYASETSIALGGEEAARSILRSDVGLLTKVAGPLAEARYKAFNRFIDAYNNVLELAVGGSVERGISISDDPTKTYIGVDLPIMIEDAKKCVAEMAGATRVNHFLEPANVLSYDELVSACGHLGEKRELLIMNEGLWLYLTADEQYLCAENIRKLLERYGGEWVTPDIEHWELRERVLSSFSPEVRLAVQRIVVNYATLTGRDVDKNFFATERDALRFISEAGFVVKRYPVVNDVDSLTSVARLWEQGDRASLEPALKLQELWVMSLR